MMFYDAGFVVGIEVFCTVSALNPSKYDLLFVSEEHKAFFLLTESEPFFDVKITNRIIFDALVGGLLNIGFKKRNLKIV